MQAVNMLRSVVALGHIWWQSHNRSEDVLRGESTQMKRVHLLLLLMAVAFVWVARAQALSQSDIEGAGGTCGKVGLPLTPITWCEKCETNLITGTRTCTTYHCDQAGQSCHPALSLDPVVGVGDVTGDAVADVAVWDPIHGEGFVFSGADGTLLSTLSMAKKHGEATLQSKTARPDSATTQDKQDTMEQLQEVVALLQSTAGEDPTSNLAPGPLSLDSNDLGRTTQLRCDLGDGCVVCCHVSRCCTACTDIPPFCNFAFR